MSVLARNIIIGVGIAVWVLTNFVVANTYTAKRMRETYIQGQCLIGQVCANVFYSLAWFLKGLRFIVLATIK